jgi:hypothetical protein
MGHGWEGRSAKEKRVLSQGGRRVVGVLCGVVEERRQQEAVGRGLADQA